MRLCALRVAELEAHAEAAAGGQRPAADAAVLQEVAQLRTRVLELQAARPSGSPNHEGADPGRPPCADGAAEVCDPCSHWAAVILLLGYVLW